MCDEDLVDFAFVYAVCPEKLSASAFPTIKQKNTKVYRRRPSPKDNPHTLNYQSKVP